VSIWEFFIFRKEENLEERPSLPCGHLPLYGEKGLRVALTGISGISGKQKKRASSDALS